MPRPCHASRRRTRSLAAAFQTSLGSGPCGACCGISSARVAAAHPRGGSLRRKTLEATGEPLPVRAVFGRGLAFVTDVSPALSRTGVDTSAPPA